MAYIQFQTSKLALRVQNCKESNFKIDDILKDSQNFST